MEASARTVVPALRFTKRNMLHFLGRAVAAQRLVRGNGTRKNIPACARKRQNDRATTSFRLPFEATAHIMNLDFRIFYSERLTNEVEERPAL